MCGCWRLVGNHLNDLNGTLLFRKRDIGHFFIPPSFPLPALAVTVVVASEARKSESWSRGSEVKLRDGLVEDRTPHCHGEALHKYQRQERVGGRQRDRQKREGRCGSGKVGH